MKHFLLKKHIWAMLLFAFVATSAFAQPAWTYVNTGSNHTILIQPGVVTIDGIALSSGDYIGVFYNQSGTLTCAGYIEWLGSATAISAWGTESGMNNGFANNEAFNWKVWQASTGYVIDMTAAYQPGFPNVGTYITNGMSGLATLTGNAPVVSFNAIGIATNVNCFAACNGAIDVTVTGGLAPYTYAWSNGATTQDVAELCAGTYTVTVSDANYTTPTGGPFSWTYVNTGSNHTILIQPGVATINGQPIVSGDVVGVFYDESGVSKCAGYIEYLGDATAISAWGAESGVDNGFQSNEAFTWKVWQAATGNVVDMTPTYQVGFPNVGTYITNGMSGLASLTGTAAVSQGNSIVLDFIISQPVEMLVTSTVSDYAGYNVSTNGGMDGSIGLTVSGGTSPYVYSWSNGAATQQVANLTAGFYSVTVTDVNGCFIVQNFELTQPLLIPLVIEAVTNDNVCNAACSGSINLSVVGGVPPYTFTWSNSETSEDLLNLCAGTYQVTVSDAGVGPVFQSQSFTYIISEPAAIMSSAVVNDVLCFDGNSGSINLTVSGGVAPYSYLWSNGLMTEDLLDLVAGAYSVTVTDANNCIHINSFTITQPEALTLDAVVTDLYCNGTQSGSIVTIVSGGVAPYTYYMNSQVSTASIFNLSGGTYTIDVMDANGCFAQGIYSIAEPTALTLNLTSTNVSCNSAADGSVSSIVTGGTAPYTYVWGNQAGNVSAQTGLVAGEYALTVTDVNGCLVTDAAMVTQPNVLAVEGTVSVFGDYNISINGAADGFIHLAVTGGTTPYTYSWSNGSFSANLNNIMAGEYFVTITDAHACSVTYSAVLTQPDPAVVITASAVLTHISCFGASNGAINQTVSGGIAPYTFAWSNNATTEDISNLAPGTYDVTIYDSNLDFVVTSYMINEPASLELLATPSNFNGYGVACFNSASGYVNTTVSGGTLPYTYIWSNGSTNANLSNLNIGSYGVTVTDANGCFVSASTSLNQPYALASMSSVANVSCFGGSNGTATFTVTAGGVAPYSYIWSNGATLSQNTGLVAGVYSVTASDANGCSVTTTRTITQPTQLVAAIGTYTNPTCFGFTNGTIPTIVTGGSTPYSYNWSDENFTTTATLSNAGAGTYLVTVTDSHGCTNVLTQSLVNPVVLEMTSSFTDLTCNGISTGAISVNPVGGTGAYTYSWSNGATTAALTGLAAGNYTTTVKDANNCQLTESFTLAQPAAISFTSEVVNVDCNGNANGTANVTLSGGVAPYSIVWSTNATTNAVSGLSGGVYSFDVVDANLCSFEGSVSIYEPTSISITGTVTHISCNNDNDGALSISVSGGTAPYTYVWSNGSMSASLTDLAGGDYTVTVLDYNNCAQTAIFTVNNPAPVSAELVIDHLNCFGDVDGAINATPIGGTAPYYYAWSTGVFVQNLNNLVAGDYSLTVTDINGCSGVIVANLIQPEQLVASHSSNSYNGYGVSCYGASDGIIDLSVTGGVSPYTYLWSNGANTQDISGLAAGEYSVGVIDANGCSIAEGPEMPWTYVNTGVNHSILIPDAIVNGVSIQAGDYIGVFFDKNGVLTCGGYIEWTGVQSAISAWGSEAEEDNGFQENEEFVWKVWRSADDVIIDMTPVYNTLSFPNTNFYTINGLSGLTSLTGSGPALQPNLGYFIVLTQPEPLTATGIASAYNGYNLSCNGGNNGAITLDIVTCLTDYSIEWNNGATTAAISGLAAGNYSSTISYTVGEPIQSVPFSWTYVNTGSNHTIFIPSASINGMPLEIGDYIGVFYDNNGTLTCGGYSQWTGTQTAITAWGTESGFNNGFADNEAFNWKVYRVLDGQVVDMVASYSPGFPNMGMYITNGISGLSSLTGEASISTFTGEVVLNFTLTQPEALSLSATVSNNACFGESIGSIVSTTVGGVEPYTYLWSNGATTADLASVANGEYTVTVTDANGCIFQTGFTVSQPEALAAIAQITNVSCNGGTNGAIVATVSGGLAPYAYLWSTGGTDSSISNLTAGTYELQVIDANNCTYLTAFTVSEPMVLNLTAAVTNVSCFGLSTASIITSVEGGTSPYTYSWSNSAVSANLTAIPDGTYSLTVVDAKGCSTNDTWTVTEPAALAINEIVTNVTCFGGNNGGIDLNVSGGTTPYAYTWSTNATTAAISGVPANAYYATVVDANGCSVNKQIFINQPTKITSDAVVTNITCFGANNGAVNLTVNGGVLPYSFMWSNGQTTEDISGLTPGQKSVIIEDANGCAATKSVVVTEPAALNVLSQVSNVSCNGGANGAINITVYGGTIPFIYNWSNGSTTQDLTNLVAGNYHVTVTDAKGCQQLGSYTITQPTALDVNYQVSSYGAYNVSAFGANDGFIILDVDGGTFPYFYNWSNAAQTYYQIYIGAGTYNVTVTDLKGCSEVVSVTLTSAPAYTPMALTITPSNYTGYGVSCFGVNNGTAAVNVANGTAPYTYAWSNGAAASSVSSLTAGTYTVTVTDATGTTETQSVVITTPTEIMATGAATNPTCFGGSNGSISLNLAGGVSPYTYLWSNTSTGQNPTGLAAGNYTITVTDARNCHDVATLTVTNPAQMTVQYQVTNPMCFDDGTVIATAADGLAPYTYAWSTGATGNTITDLAGGTYTLTVGDANGCSYVSQTMVAAGDPVSAQAMIDHVSCNGGNDASISLVIDGGSSPYTLLWNTSSTAQTLMGLAAGNYSVVITDDNACSVSYNYTITEPVALAATSVVTNVSCYDEEDGSIDLSVNGGTAPYTYSWNDAVTTSDRNNLVHGTYTVTISDANACTLVYAVSVTQPDQISLSSSITNLTCFKSNDGDIDITLTGGVAPFTYYWSNGSTNQDLVNIKAGQYTLVVIDANGCTVQSGVFTVTQPNAIVAMVTLGTPVGCSGSSNGSLNSVVSGGSAPYSYAWSTNETTSSISGLSGGVYTLTVTDANGCQTTGSYSLVEPNSFTGIVYSTNVSCYGDNDGVAEAIALGGQYPFTFNWSTGAVTESIVNLTAGTYTVTIVDANNCENIQTTTITQPTQISVSFITFAQSATPGSNAIVMANVSGGTGPYTYLWNNTVVTSYIKYVHVGDIVNLVVTDANGCQSIINYTITPGSVTNPTFESEFYAYLSELSIEVQDMNIYPNPSNTGNFFIEFNRVDAEDMIIQLFDSYGRLVNDYTIQHAGQNVIEVRMSSYASGVYMVRFIDEHNQVITKRVVLSE